MTKAKYIGVDGQYNLAHGIIYDIQISGGILGLEVQWGLYEFPDGGMDLMYRIPYGTFKKLMKDWEVIYE